MTPASKTNDNRPNDSHEANVWEYRGVNTLKSGRTVELELHPTVKPWR